jgi:hypothetical protein
MKRLTILLLIVGLVLYGCTTTTAAPKENSTPASCPPCPAQQIKEVTIEKTEYVCWDNSTVSSISQCAPQPEKVTVQTNEVTVTKYVCNDGSVKSKSEDCFSSQSTQTITGDSPDVRTITLKKGAAIFDMNYEGTRNFIVDVTTANGGYVSGGNLANEIGAFQGKRMVTIPTTGNYLLEIGHASGDYTIVITN